MTSPSASVRITVAPVSAVLATATGALRVAADQIAYVGDVAFNLSDARRDPLSDAMAVLADDRVVGFYRLDFAPNAVAGRDLGEPALGLRAMMIDAGMQGLGYGTLALQACCDDASLRHPHRRLLALAVHGSNHRALGVYHRAGFVDSGQRLPGGAAGEQHLLLRRLQPRPSPASPAANP